MQQAPAPERGQARLRPWLTVGLIAFAVLAVDQLTKWLIVRWLTGEAGEGRVDLIRPWLALVYVENRGAAFGLFGGQSDLLLVAAIIVVIGIALTFHRMMGASHLLTIAIGLIIGGAVGNISDRLRLGYVIDFVAVGPWPRFNVADAAISVGVLLMVGAVLFASDPDERAATHMTLGRGRARER
ncbi:MAG: signal peptidase II [Chloroflexia bacterium]|nr:signal peptidase II [Chloroflexia bacterium]